MERENIRVPDYDPSSPESDDDSGLESKKKDRPNRSLEKAPAEEVSKEPMLKGTSLFERILKKPFGTEEEAPTAEEKPDEAKLETDEQPSDLGVEAAAELPLDKLTEDERTEVAQQILAARQRELATQLESGVEAAEEVVITADFIAATRRHQKDTPSIEASTEAATAEIKQAYGLEIPPVGADTVEMSPPESVVVPLAEQLDDDTEAADQRRGYGFMAPRAGQRAVTLPSLSVRHAAIGYAGTLGRGEQYDQADVDQAEWHGTVKGLLVGGIVGYLVGKRRGRIKAEKQFQVVQKKLEAEVRAIHEHITEKEQQIHSLVAARAAVPELQRSAVPPERLPSQQPESRLSAVAPAMERPPERLGSVTLKATEARPSVPPTLEAKPAATRQTAEHMSRDDLLEVAEKIAVGGTTLRQVFETNLVSERGLRRAVAEHLRGGDVRRILAEELLIKELSYERDPLLRDQQVKPTANGSLVPLATPHAQIMADVQQSTGLSVPSGVTLPTQTFRSTRAVPPVLIVANVVAVVVLAILVVILFMTRLV